MRKFKINPPLQDEILKGISKMDKYIVKVNVNHYPRYKFYEEFLPHHLFEILGTNKMN